MNHFKKVNDQLLAPKTPAGKKKVGTVMGEYKKGELHSGNDGLVKNKKQAIAIALSVARKQERS